MKATFSPRALAQAKKPAAAPSLAYKPFSIGSVIQTLMEEQHSTIADVGTYMKVRKRTVQKWLHRAYLNIPQTMKLSEYFGKNLMALYHPNVKDEENPLTLVIAQLKKENETLREVKLDNEDLTKENLRLEGKVEELEKMMEKMMRRG